MFDILGFINFCVGWLMTTIIVTSPVLVLGGFVFVVVEDIISQRKRDKERAEWLNRVRK